MTVVSTLAVGMSDGWAAGRRVYYVDLVSGLGSMASTAGEGMLAFW